MLECVFTAYCCTDYFCSVVKVDAGALWFLCLWASLGFKTLLADGTSAMHEDYFNALLQNTTTAVHVLRHVTVSFRWYISVCTIFKLNFDRNAVKIWFEFMVTEHGWEELAPFQSRSSMHVCFKKQNKYFYACKIRCKVYFTLLCQGNCYVPKKMQYFSLIVVYFCFLWTK